MQYTLWSRGRVLGETDLGFVFREYGFRCGWLHPTALGERLLPAATAIGPAMRTAWIIGPDATARADVASAVDQEQALELELRGPDGAAVATESIDIVDTHYLLSISESDLGDEDAEEAEAALDPECQAEIDALVAEWDAERVLSNADAAWDLETEFPRYQIQIRLVDHDSGV